MLSIIKKIINQFTFNKESIKLAYWRFLTLSLFFSFIFFYFKTYKYNRYIVAMKRKLKALPAFKQFNYSTSDRIVEFFHLYYEDIMIAFILSFLIAFVLIFRRKYIRQILQFTVSMLGIFIFLVMIGDSQVFRKFGVSINWELLTFSFAFPKDLMQSNSGHGSISRPARYALFFIFFFIFYVYIIYSDRFLIKVKKNIKPVFIVLLCFLIIVNIIRFTSKPGRMLASLNKNFVAIIIKDILEGRDKVKTEDEKIIKQYPYKSGHFKKVTGLKNLDIKKTNIVIILLESTSAKYMYLKKYRKNIFPFLSALMDSKEAISVNRFYAPIPRSCKARATMMTGNYIRPEGYYRIDEKYKLRTLPRYLNKNGYSSYYLHTCDLNFDHQKQYFSKLGLEIWDGEWFVKNNKGKEYDKVGWGFDDRLLNSVAMETVFNKHLKKRGAPKDTPFFVIFSMINSHHPYSIPKGLKIPKSVRKYRVKYRKKRYLKSLYFSDLVAKDLVKRLKKEGVYDNTLLIVLGDHGESFLEHGYEIHNFSIFNEEIQVPFFISHPAFKNSKIHKLKMGSELDIFPSVLDIMGLQLDVSFSGFSIFNQIEDRTVYLNSWTNPINIGKIAKSKKYIYNSFDEQLNIYDVIKDPFEENPLTINDGKTYKGRLKKNIVQELQLARKVITHLHIKHNYFIKN